MASEQAPRATITVLIPVLGRPERVQPVIDSVYASAAVTPVAHLFLATPGDTEQLAALASCRANYAVVPWDRMPGDYARKINYGARFASSPFVFLGADDLRFPPGWAERALACHLETRACVVGTNDAGARATATGDASTHSLIYRDYLGCGLIDEPDSGKILYEGYDHNFVDVELVATARYRQTYAHAADCVVEHHHPVWKRAEWDATYALGQAGMDADRSRYEARRHLWNQ